MEFSDELYDKGDGVLLASPYSSRPFRSGINSQYSLS